MTARYQVDVAIVGGGPVGMTLALELGRRGRSVAVIERETELSRIPKGQNLTNRSLEILHFLGVEPEMRRARLISDAIPIGGVTAYDNLLSSYWHAIDHSPGRGDEFMQYFYCKNDRMPQYQTEAVLRRRAQEFANIQTWYGWEATEIDQDADGIVVSAVASSAAPDARSGQSRHRQCAAHFLVGCDGAHSFVRERAAITAARDDFDRVMMLAVFRSRRLNELLGGLPPRTTYRVIRPDLDGYWEFFGRVDDCYEWFFHAPVAEGGTRPEVDAYEVMQRAVGAPFDCEFVHVGYWNLRISIADQYRAGRVFIAGDAAHSHPPYGGFGLNSGLEDATNLAWKLDAALSGWGTDQLLDTYHAERRPVFVGIRDLIVGGIDSDRAFLDAVRKCAENDPAEFERLWAEYCDPLRPAGLTYFPHYSGSPIVDGPPGARSGVDGVIDVTARPGGHLAPCALDDGSNVYEHLGSGFTLLCLGTPDSWVSSFVTAAQRLGIPLTVVRDAASAARVQYGAPLVLVRPDQYVAWIGDSGSRAADVLRLASGKTRG